MANIQDLQAAKKATYDKLINDCGVFFAFSTEQFHANKTPLAEGEKYIHFGAGGYMPKSQKEKFFAGMDEAEKAYKKALKANRTLLDADIVYNLANHECYYTYDITPVIQLMKGIATPRQIQKVFDREKAKHD